MASSNKAQWAAQCSRSINLAETPNHPVLPIRLRLLGVSIIGVNGGHRQSENKMEITITQLRPRDSMNKVLVNLYIHDNEKSPHDNVQVEVFVDYTDSFLELRKNALLAARSFLEKCLVAEFIENKKV